MASSFFYNNASWFKISSSIHVISNYIISFFLWLTSIPLCVYTTSSLSIICCEHLGCFHVLAIVNSAAMNIGVHVYFWTIVLSGYMPRNGIVGMLDCMSTLYSAFWRNFILFSIVAVPIYIPTSSVEGSLFSVPSPAFIICRLLMMTILTDVSWYLMASLICIALIT